MRRLSFGVLLIALATLVLELMLARVFDVIIAPNVSYVVVTAAVFAFGLAGIFSTLRPIDTSKDISNLLCWNTVGFAAASVLLIPLMNALNLDYEHMGSLYVRVPLSYLVLYFALVAPFFIAGYVLISVFTKYSSSIQQLYFWDLIGAGLGSVIAIPFMLKIGPAGLILCAGALGLLAAALFSNSRRRSWILVAAAAVAIAAPFLHAPKYFDFDNQVDKREVRSFLEKGLGEVVRWDPISKITIIDETWTPEIARSWHVSGDRKAVQYDDGNQTSYFYKFDGNLAKLRAHVDEDKRDINEHFWQIGVLGSHYLKRDTKQDVLILGSAGGQETKAALIYGARHVDSIEMVPTVVELGTGQYSSYIGDIFKNPAVHVQPGEGRSFLRSTGRQYDIIQIYSNHTSSRIAQGTGALQPVYLQTTEAYKEYFAHLKPDGVLHINHHVYPRMIATAALAWKEMGRTDFEKHVVVFYSARELTLPTLLFKNSPWTAAEIDSLEKFYAPPEVAPEFRLEIVEHPLDPKRRFLTHDFYSGDFPAALAERTAVNFTPRTDDNPYFGMLRKHVVKLDPNPSTFLDPGSAYFVNESLNHGVPMDWAHLIVTSVLSIVFVVLFVAVPLRFSKVGRQQGSAASPLMTYFACLGAGFIIIELVFIQKFIHLIGTPLYTYATVIFTMLFAAGVGSAASEKLGIRDDRRWQIPFIGILVTGGALVAGYPMASYAALSLPLAGRVVAAFAMIFPLGFFMGMPFPLGVLAIRQRPAGAVAWAWGMNGLFTVCGGLLSAFFSVLWGFNATILIALGLYGVAFAVFPALCRGSVPVRLPQREGSEIMRGQFSREKERRKVKRPEQTQLYNNPQA